jgi:hypothetical protein
MRILDYNLLRDATVSTSSAADLFPSTNLYSRRKMQQFRFTGKDSEYITVYTSGLSFDAVVIDNHNLTDDAVVKLQANATDSWASPSVDITATVADVISYNWSAVQEYDYFRVYIEDTTNLEAVRIGMLFLAEGKDFDIRHNWGVNKIFAGRVTYRTIEGSFPYLISADKEAIEEFIENSAGTISLSATRQQFGSAWPFYVIIDDDGSFLPMLAVCQDGINLMRKKTADTSWEGPFIFEEVF